MGIMSGDIIMRLITINKYIDFTRFENTREELGERFDEALESHIKEYGEIDEWRDDYPGLAIFYFWFQDFYGSRYWENKINQWRTLFDNIESELDLDFNEHFINILHWLEDYAENR